MCESCETGRIGLDRRTFLKSTTIAGAALGAGAFASTVLAASDAEPMPPLSKEKAKVLLLFMYPPIAVVEEGRFEDNWAKDHWFTYPGNQFQYEENHRLFKEKIEQYAKEYDLEIQEAPVVYTKAACREFTDRALREKPDALLIVNFYNTMSGWSYEIAKEALESGIVSVVYQPVGSNHQLPPRALIDAGPGIHYIHSIRNWEQIEHALAALNAKKRLSRTRLLRIGNFKEFSKTTDKNLGSEIICVPGQEFNDLFDSIEVTDDMRQAAAGFRNKAKQIIDVEDKYVVEGFRSYHAVRKIMHRYGADAITIRCLMLKERKPCIGFSLLNSELVACACEDQPDSALTLVLGSLLFKRGGFMHNPEFDIDRNQYYGAHCTSALKMYGPEKEELPFRIRPFTHQAPKTAALDIEMPPGGSGVVTKYVPGKKLLCAYSGRIDHSPEINVAGGCATRFIMDIDKLENVCDMYNGPHPILYLVEPALPRRLKVFAKLAGLEWQGNFS